MGTAAYLAPERAAGMPATPAADLYALGIVAYQCLTGRVPFHGEPLAHREQPLPSSVPADVAALVTDLTAKDPSARPASAGEVAERAEHVRAVLTAPGVTAPGAVRSRGPGRRVARLPGRAALVLAAIIAIAAASWVVTGLRGPASGHSQPGPSAAVQHPDRDGHADRHATAERVATAERDADADGNVGPGANPELEPGRRVRHVTAWLPRRSC